MGSYVRIHSRNTSRLRTSYVRGNPPKTLPSRESKNAFLCALSIPIQILIIKSKRRRHLEKHVRLSPRYNKNNIQINHIRRLHSWDANLLIFPFFHLSLICVGYHNLSLFLCSNAGQVNGPPSDWAPRYRGRPFTKVWGKKLSFVSWAFEPEAPISSFSSHHENCLHEP